MQLQILMHIVGPSDRTLITRHDGRVACYLSCLAVGIDLQSTQEDLRLSPCPPKTATQMQGAGGCKLEGTCLLLVGGGWLLCVWLPCHLSIADLSPNNPEMQTNQLIRRDHIQQARLDD